MIAAIKEGVLPYAMWILVMGTALLGMAHRAAWPVLLLALLAPLPTLWYPTHELPLGKDTQDLLVLAALIGVTLQRPGWQRIPHSGCILLMAVFSYASLWICSARFSLPPPLSLAHPYLAEWKNFILLLLAYLAAFGALRTEAQVRSLVMISLCVLLFVAQRELQLFVAGEAFSYGRRADGPFWVVGLNANHFGAYMAHFGALALGLALTVRADLHRLFYAAAYLSSLYPLLFSYSRAAYLAALGALTVFGVIKRRSLLGLVLLIGIVWQTILPASVVDRIVMTEEEDGVLEASAAARIEVWEHARTLFFESPIAGIGFNGFMAARAGESLTDPHNYYLKIAAEQGVIGLVLLFGLIAAFMHSSWVLHRSGRSVFARGLGAGGLGMLVALLVTNAFGNRFTPLAIGIPLFLMLGAIERMRVLDAAAAKAGVAPEGPAIRSGRPTPSRERRRRAEDGRWIQGQEGGRT